jgi:hypothetical protein
LTSSAATNRQNATIAAQETANATLEAVTEGNSTNSAENSNQETRWGALLAAQEKTNSLLEKIELHLRMAKRVAGRMCRGRDRWGVVMRLGGLLAEERRRVVVERW